MHWFLLLLAVLPVYEAKPHRNESCIGVVCWEDPSYPLKAIKTKFYSNNDYMKTFGKISDQERVRSKSEEQQSCGLCNIKKSLKVKPLSIMDGKTKKYVLHTTRYQHYITLNVCGNQETSKCNKASSNSQLDYYYECQQKETRMKVLTYNFDRNTFEEHYFNYPSACTCEAKQIIDDQ